MKQYFFKVTSDYWQAQNRLQEDAKKVAREVDCILVPEHLLDEFVENNIYRKIQSLNIRHNRCKPLRIEMASQFNQSKYEETYIIPGVTHITRYLVRSQI